MGTFIFATKDSLVYNRKGISISALNEVKRLGYL